MSTALFLRDGGLLLLALTSHLGGFRARRCVSSLLSAVARSWALLPEWHQMRCSLHSWAGFALLWRRRRRKTGPSMTGRGHLGCAHLSQVAVGRRILSHVSGCDGFPRLPRTRRAGTARLLTICSRPRGPSGPAFGSQTMPHSLGHLASHVSPWRGHHRSNGGLRRLPFLPSRRWPETVFMSLVSNT